MESNKNYLYDLLVIPIKIEKVQQNSCKKKIKYVKREKVKYSILI